MTTSSVHDIRRELVEASFQQLGDGTSSFAIEHLHDLVENHRDLEDLRVAISGLAVRGGLSESEPTDGHIDELLKALAEGKEKVVNAPGARRSTSAGMAEPPGTLPDAWRWVALADITALYNGHAFKSHDWKTSGLPIVRIQNLNKLHAPFNFADPTSVPERVQIDDGDLLLSWSGTPGTSFGVFVWNRGPAALNQHIFKCVLYGAVNSRYLQIAVNEGIRKSLGAAHGGVGLKHLTKKTLESMPVPLPPRAEQDRIVSAVDALDERVRRLQELLAPVGASDHIGALSDEDDVE